MSINNHAIEPLISIIVPCYNVENYLVRCLDSLLSQTYENIEVIMVEDCSTDNTREIVRSYAKKYDNFKAIYNKKNGGLGNARNVGIDSAKTEYIAFLDSDDWFPDSYLEDMLNTLISNKADISICDIYLRFDDSSKDQRVKSFDLKPDKIGLINTSMAASSCNKLFKRELFEDLRYPPDIVNEDIPIILYLMIKHKVTYSKVSYFNYYQRTGSIQNSKITNKRFDIFKAVSLLKDNLNGQVDQDVWQAVVWHQILAIFIYVLPKAKGVFHRRNLVKEFHNLTIEHGVDIINNMGLENFKSTRKINRFYGEYAIKWLLRRRYLSVSILMALYYVYVNNRLIKIFMFGVNHPKQLLKKIISKFISKRKVIRKNITMDDLVDVAKKQKIMRSSDTGVSVVIPNYNYEKFLLQRVYSVLAQTNKVDEILVLDDCSSDNSIDLAEKIKVEIDQYVPIRLINNEVNRGTFHQWEKGFSESKGKYIWLAEADDYSDKNFLKYALRPFRSGNNIVISYVNTGYIDKDGLLLGNVRQDIDYQNSGHWDRDYVNNGLDEVRQYSYLNNTISNVSSVVFYKKDDIDYKKMFKDARNYKQAGDWILYVNYMMHGDVAYTNKVLNYYRLHGNNVSATTRAGDHIGEIQEVYKLFTKELDLSRKHQERMKARIEFLKKAWKME